MKIAYYNKMAKSIMSCESKEQLKNCCNFPVLHLEKFRDHHLCSKLMGYLELRKNQILNNYMDIRENKF